MNFIEFVECIARIAEKAVNRDNLIESAKKLNDDSPV